MSARHSILVLLVVLVGLANAQAQSIPKQYIEEGLANNLVIQQKQVGLEKSLLAIKEARSLFLPTTWFEGQYSVAKGGRSIDIPVGDLLNPVYKSLNQLTSSNSFPTVRNVSEQLLPDNFYDLRVRTTMPLVNTEIKWNQRIKAQESILQKEELDTYKRELVKEIKTAYYLYELSQVAIGIYTDALTVVNQNLKINQSLLKNGKGLPAYVIRAESEVQNVLSDLQTAKNKSVNAKAYFNFLLNKSLNDSIIVTEANTNEINALLAAISSGQINQREELKSIRTARSINASVLKMRQSFRTPKLNAFLDLASQGYDFHFDSKTIYYLAGVQMQIPIFTGKRNLYKINQSEWDDKNLSLKENEITNQISLAVLTSRNNVTNAYNVYLSAKKQQQAAEQYFRLMDKGYREGVNSFIENLEARNSLTKSQLETAINYYKVLAAFADYERQSASYSF